MTNRIDQAQEREHERDSESCITLCKQEPLYANLRFLYANLRAPSRVHRFYCICNDKNGGKSPHSATMVQLIHYYKKVRKSARKKMSQYNLLNEWEISTKPKRSFWTLCSTLNVVKCVGFLMLGFALAQAINVIRFGGIDRKYGLSVGDGIEAQHIIPPRIECSPQAGANMTRGCAMELQTEHADKWIVVTSISDVTDAVRLFSALSQPERGGWKTVIVADVASPAVYEALPGVIFLPMSIQRELPYRIVSITPEKSYTRKNIGYLFAARHGAKIILEH